MGFQIWKRFSSAASFLLMAFGLAASVSAAEPGQVLWTFFDVLQVPVKLQSNSVFFNGSNGDNILRLINPNGAANGNLAGAKEQTVCAMIYVFDAHQEMGACCGCPVSSAGLATFSVDHNLIADWSLGGPFGVTTGSLAVAAASPNAPLTCLGLSGACNGGCDPTNIPGYSLTTGNNLLGSMTHNQFQAEIVAMGTAVPAAPVQITTNITEAELSDDSAGDLNNATYLQNQCGAIIGNGSGGGICTCPVE